MWPENNNLKNWLCWITGSFQWWNKKPLKRLFKTFAGILWFDGKDETGKNKRLQKNNSNGNRAAGLHAPTNYRTKNAVALQIFSSRRRRKEGDYACTQKKRFLQRNPLWTRKFSMGYRPWREKTLPLSFECSDIENWQNYLMKWKFLNFFPSGIQFKDTKVEVFQSRSRLNVLHHRIRLWWMSSRPFFSRKICWNIEIRWCK